MIKKIGCTGRLGHLGRPVQSRKQAGTDGRAGRCLVAAFFALQSLYIKKLNKHMKDTSSLHKLDKICYLFFFNIFLFQTRRTTVPHK
ncbi:hypothetical protein BpHYR1_051812 [Brachionus plicatilis]|uniref:Uncharacterized protein n=1 Tax=Brachionus plicatilis TaxID=10195 RepID=A0A3M7QEL8_BRAPC|nr:hypothetical protein BpHYR1_051812 [Brachionus plicatilis]